jgi:protein-disulfide isomerase-like protein with CxxC motif
VSRLATRDAALTAAQAATRQVEAQLEEANALLADNKALRDAAASEAAAAHAQALQTAAELAALKALTTAHWYAALDLQQRRLVGVDEEIVKACERAQKAMDLPLAWICHSQCRRRRWRH